MSMGDALAVEEQRSLLSVQSRIPEPEIINKLVRRIRALVAKLLPVQVEIDSITDATSSIITPVVIHSFAKCGGDFGEAVPFCLLRARATFMADAYNNPPDYDESLCRATACEVLARRIVHGLELEKLETVMSTRFRYRESDGDISPPNSALETAIDQHCTIFLSSTEAQYVVNALWRGDWVQRNNDNDEIDYETYHPADSNSFWDHLDPQRISVPRYQSAFKMVVWTIFLFVYSQSVQSPLDQFDPDHNFDPWEYVLYTMTVSFILEDIVKVWKTLKIAPQPMKVIGFWTVINFITATLLLAAFVLRVMGLVADDHDQQDTAELWHRKSFQVLSTVAPLIWIRLLTVFDGYKIVGTLQVVVFRMLRESAIFFILLAIIGIGFLQSLYALDAADGESTGGVEVMNNLIQALLGSPDFASPNERFGYPFGLIIYYMWNFLASIILVNVLIALFGSAYSDVEENATDEYLAFFAHKTIELIRAPDSFVYPAPFNLVEIVFIAPFERLMSRDFYVRLNRFVMSILLFIPLVIIAVFESQIARSRSERVRAYFNGSPPEEDGDPASEDPEGNEEGEISKISFEELTKRFPNTAMTEGAVVHREIKSLQEKVDKLERMIREMTPASEAKVKEDVVEKEGEKGKTKGDRKE